MPGFLLFKRLFRIVCECAFSHSSASTCFDPLFRTRRCALSRATSDKKLVCKISGKKWLWVGVEPDATTERDEDEYQKLSIVLLAGIATLVTVTEPTLAAKRKHRAYDAYASGAVTDVVPAPTHSGPVRGEALTPAQHNYDRTIGQNLPYPDRPYGDPDSW